MSNTTQTAQITPLFRKTLFISAAKGVKAEYRQSPIIMGWCDQLIKMDTRKITLADIYLLWHFHTEEIASITEAEQILLTHLTPEN